MEQRGEFGCSNSHFQASYGTSSRDLDQAVVSQEHFYVLDFLIKDAEKLQGYPHRKVIVVPESVAQLDSQIASAGRDDRRDAILVEYEKEFSEERLRFYSDCGFVIVINKFGRIRQTAMEILRLWGTKATK